MKHFKLTILFFTTFFLIIVLGISFYSPKSDMRYESNLLVVLGAGFLSSGKPVRALEERLLKSISLWSESKVIMVSGREEEVQVMNHYLQDKGIKKEFIILDVLGIDTKETVINALQLAYKMNTTPTFISQAYHLPRIRMYCLKYGNNKANFIPTNRVNVSFFTLLFVSVREVGAMIVGFLPIK